MITETDFWLMVIGGILFLVGIKIGRILREMTKDDEE